MGSEEELESNYVDYYIGSVEHIRKFLENIETAHKNEFWIILNIGTNGLPKISGLASQHFTKFFCCRNLPEKN